MNTLDNQKRTIRLYGPLRQFVKDNQKGIIEMCVKTPGEGVKALCTVLPGFEKFMLTSKAKGLTFAIFNGKRNIGKDELDFNGTDEIRIVPVIIGSKQAGVFQTILGAVLVGAAAIMSGGLGAAFAVKGLAGAMAMTGTAMALGGVVQMLSPMQGGLAMRESPDNKPSYAFGGPVNTIAQGNPVPILYGKRRIGGAIISAGIYAEDQQ
ncbi:MULTISPECIES: tail assembly protein [unclassified Serratia (in: enterobacteria)]|uniref:tail assembly protein n=1 Tax=unclassified Serratia (in: enterobacteria) TaxID=2647522 RepID=UPI0005073768|nr:MULTISPECIES: tail assembly protein [unclassified Serratia (in: enterobacteria)]KFK97196.1 phage tail assembly protein [Serratia sp. Ag2]KFK98586.1 phage tail assembly protein [Serratia sp. Ag1]